VCAAAGARLRLQLCCAVLQTYVGIVATMVCCYEAMLEKHLLPDWGFDWPGLAVSTTGVYSLSTFALSLLLVFRTNSSYQRCVCNLRCVSYI
jgi:predicted membrane chloride channel (bestrophin family)